MLFSYNWLKKYVADLPDPLKVEEGFIFHSFEVEGVETKSGDTFMEIKILPDRAADCLCHQGVAREAAAILGLNFSAPVPDSDLALGRTQDLDIKIEDIENCRRYVGERVKSVKVGPSPEWLVQALESIGQRSISNIVDATNYVMFDIGQPLHAFDADKVEGGIVVRHALVGEKMTTLDGKDLVLDESVLVIADAKGPLALAGIKGGNRAEVDTNTKNLILESASFDPVLIRKTSANLGIRTDASKRFENNLSRETVLPAMVQLADLLQTVAGGEYSGVVDVYPTKQAEKEIIVDINNVKERLGVEVSADEIKDILTRLGIQVVAQDGKLGLTIPYWRVDLQGEANIVEEVGRIYGYEKIKGKIPGGIEQKLVSEAEKRFNFANKIRLSLKQAGFTEVYGYAFAGKGEVELANPLAVGKEFLRTNLSDWLIDKLKFNLSYLLFDNEAVKIFEIGKVFVSGQEEARLGLGIAYRKKIKGQNAKEELEKILEVIGAGALVVGDEVLASQEINFENLAQKSEKAELVLLEDLVNKKASYKIVSSYPRIIRDVAVWVPEVTSSEEVGDLIKKSVSDLCVFGPVLFDEFAKEGKKSLAFRLVFQSYDRTLSDDEANTELDKVIEALEAKGYEVRK